MISYHYNLSLVVNVLCVQFLDLIVFIYWKGRLDLPVSSLAVAFESVTLHKSRGKTV